MDPLFKHKYFFFEFINFHSPFRISSDTHEKDNLITKSALSKILCNLSKVFFVKILISDNFKENFLLYPKVEN